MQQGLEKNLILLTLAGPNYQVQVKTYVQTWVPLLRAYERGQGANDPGARDSGTKFCWGYGASKADAGIFEILFFFAAVRYGKN